MYVSTAGSGPPLNAVAGCCRRPGPKCCATAGSRRRCMSWRIVGWAGGCVSHTQTTTGHTPTSDPQTKGRCQTGVLGPGPLPWQHEQSQKWFWTANTSKSGERHRGRGREGGREWVRGWGEVRELGCEGGAREGKHGALRFEHKWDAQYSNWWILTGHLQISLLLAATIIMQDIRTEAISTTIRLTTRGRPRKRWEDDLT